MHTVSGQLVDILNRNIYPAEIKINEGRILHITRVAEAPQQFILPGFIDAHIHIESSMLVPAAFAKIAVVHGTVATVSDPHEIANVCGVAGVDYMIENAALVPFKFNFGAPSCVPATTFETAGAVIGPEEVRSLLQRTEIKYLTEMMNFPGALQGDPDVLAKIQAAKDLGKPVDGHAPGLKGEHARQYAALGITTDHECVELEEALDKINAGMYILIREGSAAKNFDALISLLQSHPGKVMFCSDDKHPDELVKGHINQLVLRALKQGYDLYDILYAACILPVLHYKLDVGILREGDAADFIVADNLEQFNVLQTYIDGALVAEGGKSYIEHREAKAINNFSITAKKPEDFRYTTDIAAERIRIKVIEALDGQLITTASEAELPLINAELSSDVSQDILKIGVVNRYSDAPVAIGFIRNFGLKQGALASSVAHDSHNIVFVGVDDNGICEAVNGIVQHKGGISVFDGKTTQVMPLAVAGLMTLADAETAAQQYETLDAAAKALGSKLKAPFMTLSFMALPVIPNLKMTDKGLFDVSQFKFVPLIAG
jgi:adenine deaminase